MRIVVFVDFIQIDFSHIRFAGAISFFWELFAEKPSNQFHQKEQLKPNKQNENKEIEKENQFNRARTYFFDFILRTKVVTMFENLTKYKIPSFSNSY